MADILKEIIKKTKEDLKKRKKDFPEEWLGRSLAFNPFIPRDVQKALKSAGHYNGPIDGIWGSESRSATRAYQKAKGLPVAGLSVATMQSLGL